MTAGVCPSCDSDRVAKERDVRNLEGDQLTIAWCAECGLVRRSMIESRSAFHSEVNEAIYDAAWVEGREISLMLPGFEEVWRDRVDFALGDVEGLGVTTRPRLLEIGCGIGHNLAAYRRYGCDVMGVEPSEPASRFARDRFGLEVVNAMVEDADLEQGAFDLIVLDSVLEHLPDPRSTLGMLAGLLNETGRIYFDVPNLAAWEGTLLGSEWGIFEADHLTFFTPDSLRALLSRSGYRVLRMRTYETRDIWGRTLAHLARRSASKVLGRGRNPGEGGGGRDQEAAGSSTVPVSMRRPGGRELLEGALSRGLGTALTPLRRRQDALERGLNIWALAEVDR